jgi:very-short-patch-repair endonuclease
MREKPAKGDLVIARLATRQHGVVSAWQLHAARIGPQRISRHVSAGRLHRVHRGVYAVGHTNLSFEGRCMAAVLALGDESVVSHRSAAVVWGLLAGGQGPIHVTVRSGSGREQRVGIAVHRSPSLSALDSTRRYGIPVTRPARTLRDLRRTVPRPVLLAAVRRGLDLRLISSADLHDQDGLTRSELERMFLRLCRRHRLPRPELNVHVRGQEVDFLWRAQRVIAETDGWRHHGTRAGFERDRARDAKLQAAGYRVLRFTYRQVADSPGEVAGTLRKVLGDGSGRHGAPPQRRLGPDL